MKEDDQILVILEEIQEKLEELNKNQQNESSDSDDFELYTMALEECREKIQPEINNIISSNNSSKRLLNENKDKLSELITEFSNFKELKVRKEHYFLFLPDLRKWLQFIKKSTVVLFLISSLVISIVFNFIQYEENKELKPLAQKYRIARANALSKDISAKFISEYFYQLDTLFPANKENLLKATTTIEDSIKQIREREHRIKELSKELNELNNQK